MKVCIAGSSGFIGSHLLEFFKDKAELILLSRSGKKGTVYWNPSNKQIDPSALEGVDLVINLAGESIAGRWTKKKLEKIRNSRFESTEFLCDTLLGLQTPPKLYIGASAMGYYGDRGDEIVTESNHSGHGYLAEICRHWEAIPTKLEARNVRVVLARFGIILGADGGILSQMEKPFRLGLGGKLASGKQMVSWMAIDDLVKAFEHIINTHEISGPVNFSSPNAVTNIQLTKTIGRVLHRPTIFKIPKWALFLLYGSGAEMFLASVNMHPERLLKSGFQFQYPELEQALRKYLLIKK